MPANLGSNRQVGPSSSGTLPAYPTEISATAQALLKAHYDRLKAPAGTPSQASITQERQQRLQKLEQTISNLDRVCLQLDNLQVGHQLRTTTGKSAESSASSSSSSSSSNAKSGRLLQPLGPLAFWPAKVVDPTTVYVRQVPEGLNHDDQLKLEDITLPPLASVPTDADELVVPTNLTKPSRTVDVKYLKKSVKDAQLALQSRKALLEKEARILRDELMPSSTVDSKARSDQTGPSAPSSTRTQSQAGNKESQASNSLKDAHLINEDHEVLNEEGLPFYEPVEQISEEEANSQKKAYMQPFIPSTETSSTDKEGRRKWMDQLFNQLEKEEQHEASDEENGDREGETSTFTATQTGSEDKIEDADAEMPAPLPAEQETRVVLRPRTPTPPPSPEICAKPLPEIHSAARPPPPKSALKQGRPPIEQRPSFGATGIRRGFLNLNPSSPGAIKSSYSLADLERDMNPHPEERPSRSHTPTPLSRSTSSIGPVAAIKAEEQGSSPMTSGTSTPTKKSVRIKSPERKHPDASDHTGLTPLQRALKSSIRVKERDLSQPSSSSSPSSSSAAAPQQPRRAVDLGGETAEKRHKDDVGVEEEAEKIVNLLGPGVVEGHPNAPPPDILQKMQEAHEQDKKLSTPEAMAERARIDEEEREKERLARLAEKPALGQAVKERAPTASRKKDGEDAKAAVEKAKTSAFKRGFLNQKPSITTTTTKFVPNKPPPRMASNESDNGKGKSTAPPTQSLGMSALDRASLGDDELSQRRQEMGLPAAVPHARPSKAYAEKMARRQQGLDTEDSKQAKAAPKTGEEKMARPKEGDDVPRPGRVRFGESCSIIQSALQGHSAGYDGEEDELLEINPSAALDNYQEDPTEGKEIDEEAEGPKISGEGADADTTDDDEDAYFDSYMNGRVRESANNADFEDEDDDGDWDMGTEEEELDEDDFDYDPEDLLDLAPGMDSDLGSLSGNDQLMKEYNAARAKLQAMGLAMPGSGSQATDAGGLPSQLATMSLNENIDDDEDDYEDDIVPVDAAVEDPEYQGNTASSGSKGSKLSRFKASIASQRKSATSSSTSMANASSPQDLIKMLESAQNVGQGSSQAAVSAGDGMDGRDGNAPDADGGTAPVMIIPQLAPVRFPKGGDLVEGRAKAGPVDLTGGESDEDDEKAEMVMRNRLERMEWKQSHPEEATRLAENRRKQRIVAEEGPAPPSVSSRYAKEASATMRDSSGKGNVGNTAPSTTTEAEEMPPPKPKKVSRFKASRMQ